MKHLVIGGGEVGRPLYDVLRLFGHADDEVWIRDVTPGDEPATVDAVHVCYPFSDDFADTTSAYCDFYRPQVCIIHSTVTPGVTRFVQELSPDGVAVAYSPVRGRHADMHRDIVRYKKFVAVLEPSYAMLVEDALEPAFDCAWMHPVEALELAKLLSTTYTGLLIAWAQEMSRYCKEVGAEYLDVCRFFAEPGHFPPVAFQPGVIGGHCIIPNLDLLERVQKSDFVTAVRKSNREQQSNYAQLGPLRPVPMASLGEALR